MAGVPEAVKQSRQKVMESSGLVPAGTYSVQEKGDGGLYGCLPAMFCRPEDVESGDEIETYIDFENGAVIHTLPDGGVAGGDDL